MKSHIYGARLAYRAARLITGCWLLVGMAAGCDDSQPTGVGATAEGGGTEAPNPLGDANPGTGDADIDSDTPFPGGNDSTAGDGSDESDSTGEQSEEFDSSGDPDAMDLRDSNLDAGEERLDGSETADVGEEDVHPPDTVDAGDAAEEDSNEGGQDADEGGPGPTPPCGECPWNSKPTGNHPAASSILTAIDVQEHTKYGPKNIPTVLVKPTGAGPYPVVGFLHGKQLFEGGGPILGPPIPGYAYQALLFHLARRGYVVVYPKVEQNLLDADHLRMADDFLATVKYAIETESAASKTQVAFAGHSMGAKVALLAAVKATANDSNGTFVDPTALFLMAFENSPPPIGTYVDARDHTKLWNNQPIWVTFIDANDDTVAPWASTTNPNSKQTYPTMSVAHKQIIVLHGTGTGDPNPSTSPVLSDDHAAPMTIAGKNGGLGDFAMPNSALDALDWYGYWKILVGGLDYHFASGSVDWAYGALRTHGGTLPSGQVITHEIAFDDL